METTMELAERIAQGPQLSMALIKRLVHSQCKPTLRKACALPGLLRTSRVRPKITVKAFERSLRSASLCTGDDEAE